jgi:hypothetical protein
VSSNLEFTINLSHSPVPYPLAQLFKTALEGQLAEDQFVLKKQARLLNAFIKTETPLEESRQTK